MSFLRFFDNAEGPAGRHAGRVWAFGDNVSVDAIHPANYFSLDPDRCRQGLFRGIDPAIPDLLRPGDIVMAGRNFGCGSSREVYARAMLLHGVAAVVAESVARIFSRNMINHGILVLDGVSAARQWRTGDLAAIDLASGELADELGNVRARFAPLSPGAVALLRAQSLKKSASL